MLLLFSPLVVSDLLRLHGLQHARLPCPLPSSGACSNSCPLSWWCHPTISSYCPLFFLPSIFPSIRVFSRELALHIRWPKYWINSFSISPSNEYSELISFRIDWFDLLTFRGTLKSLLQHHTSKPSILWHSPFFMVQLSHPYMTTGKTIAFSRQTLVGKVMSLPFNIAVCHNFSSKKKVSFNFVAAVTICGVFGAHENKSLSLFPIYLPWSDRTRCHDLRFLNVEF